MKKTIPFSFFILFFVSTLFVKGQEQPSNDSLSFLTPSGAFVLVKGQTEKLYNKKLDSVFVKIFIEKRLIFSQFYPNGKFEIYLPLNSKLEVEVSRKNYYPKTITVNTNIPETDKKPFYLLFDFVLIEKKLLVGLDDFVLFLPAAVIGYSEETKDFTYAERYSKQIFKDVLKLIEEGEKRQRQLEKQGDTEGIHPKF